MKALAAVILALTLNACAATPADAEKHWQQPKPDSYIESVHAAWIGDSPVPDDRWLITAATLICKQAIDGQAPRAGVTGDYWWKNEHTVVYYATTMVCESGQAAGAVTA